MSLETLTTATTVHRLVEEIEGYDTDDSSMDFDGGKQTKGSTRQILLAREIHQAIAS